MLDVTSTGRCTELESPTSVGVLVSTGTHIIGRLLIAIALIVVPFSMSHASMADFTAAPQSETVHVMHDHQHMNHEIDHQMDQRSSDRSPHEGHDGANCCSSICGGALAVDVHQAKCLASSKLIHVFGSKALEPGEWVLPFRPPST